MKRKPPVFIPAAEAPELVGPPEPTSDTPDRLARLLARTVGSGSGATALSALRPAPVNEPSTAPEPDPVDAARDRLSALLRQL